MDVYEKYKNEYIGKELDVKIDEKEGDDIAEWCLQELIQENGKDGVPKVINEKEKDEELKCFINDLLDQKIT
jgi:hypothetical protein